MADYNEPLFSIPGVSSGISWGDMIDKIMEKARKPVEIWETQQDTLRLKVKLYEEFSAVLKSARNALTPLKQPSTYKMKQAEITSLTPGVSNSSILTATATTEAYIGRWNIEVLQKAVAETRIGTRFDSASKALGLTGTFSIRVGDKVAEISVAASDSLRTINQMIARATDAASGTSVGVTSKLIDNRLVISSSASGTNTAPITAGKLTRSSSGSVDTVPFRTSGGAFPDVLEIKFNSTSYQSGTDFTYNQSTGEITWLAAGDKPYIGAEYDITYSKTENITKAATNTLTLPPSGLFPTSISISGGGVTYEEGADYTYDANTGTITWLAGPADGTALTVTLGNPKVDQSVFFLEPGTGDDIIAALGLNLNDADHYTAAQNAELLVEGVRVTRSSNTIDDLIGGVTLNLQGPGKVTLDVVSDMEKAVESIEEFVAAYNDAMEWINVRLSEESAVDSLAKDDPKRSDDFYKKFGLLHGDSLLWQTKSQLRRLVTDPLNILGPLKQLSQIGISTEKTDYGKSGKLVFDKEAFMAAATPGSLPFMDQWMTDALGSSTTPLNQLKTDFAGGDFLISVGGKQARITVKATDTLADVNAKINLAKDEASGDRIRVRSTIIDNVLSIASTDIDANITLQDPNGVLKKLGIDVSNPLDATHHVQDTSAYVGNLLTAAMTNMDTYFGNLVDSSQIAVGSAVTIKGRVASQISHLNSQITSIDKRISRFEQQLSIKQRGLFDQYSQMEVTLAKLNQQYSWLASTLSALTAKQQAAS